MTLTTDLRLGFEGGQASARTLLKEGDTRFVALSLGQQGAAADLRGRVRPAGLDRAPLAALAGPREVPGPSVADLPAAQRPHPQGADLRPHRRDRRGGHDVAAGDPRWRTQLRLPLHLDPGRDVRSLGAVLDRLRLGGAGLLLLHRRRRRTGRPAADHVRHRGRAGADRVRARPPGRVRELPSGPGRQRRVRAAAARRLGGPAGLGLPARQGGRPPRRPDLADPGQAGQRGAEALAGARCRHLGGPRRAQALHLVEDHVLGGGRPRSQAGPAERGDGQGRRVGAGGGGDQGGHPRQRRGRARCAHPVLRQQGPGRLAAARARWSGSCPRTTRGSGPRCWPSPTS